MYNRQDSPQGDTRPVYDIRGDNMKAIIKDIPRVEAPQVANCRTGSA